MGRTPILKPKPVKERKLTDKQDKFCQNYAQCFDAKKAAIDAKYSEKSAEMLGYQLLQKPMVNKRIAELKAKTAKKIHISTEMIIHELYKIATVDIGDVFNKDGSLKAIHDIPKHVRQCIKGIDTYKDFTEGVEIGETKKIQLWDKMKAIELLGRYLKMFTDKIEIGLSSDLSDKLQRARERRLND